MPAPDIITLDNLSTRLTPWGPDDENHLYAIVDMGSNGIRFSITSLEPPSTRLLKPVFSTRAGISLFDALTPSDSGPVFPKETIAAVADTLAHFHRIAVLHGVPTEHIIILATEAMRRAANAADMLDAIGKATDGLGVNILDPAVETLFGAVMGSRSGLVSVDRGALFLDLGGGSVQMTWVDTNQDNYELEAAKFGVSLPFGAARLIKVLTEQTQEIQASELSKLRAGMQSAFSKLCERFPALQATKTAYEKGEGGLVDVFMCGGGFRGYGSMLMHNDNVNPYPVSSVNTYTASGELFKQTAKMRLVNENYDEKIFGLSKRRRQQFPAIVAVVDAFIATVPNIGQVTFCSGSNREGILMMKLPKEIRESNPLDVAAGLSAAQKPIFDAILQKLSDALPKEVDFSQVSTVLNTGLGHLFIHEIWVRQGHDTDSNTSYALNHAIKGHPETPGLSHTARALLGLTSASRWGGNLGSLDTQLRNGLVGVLQTQNHDAPFWAAYIGAVAGAIAALNPVFPKNPEELDKALRIESHLKKADDKKDKVILKIGVASGNTKGVNLTDLAEEIEGGPKRIGLKKPKFKISAQVNLIS